MFNFLLHILLLVPAATLAYELCPTIPIAPGVNMPMVNLGHPDGPSRGGNSTINETMALELWLSTAVNGSGIDTAMDYMNQGQVGAAMRASGRARRSLFLVTKIPNVLSRSEMVAYVKKDIEQLGGETPDVVLIHSPCSSGFESHGCKYATSEEIAQAWLGMEDALKAGLTRAIGVSNFAVSHLQPILDLGGMVPAVNQCEMYVGQYDKKTADFCKKNGITYEAYSPLGRGSLNVQDPRIQKIAQAHSKSVYQVCLRWVTQLGSPMAVSSTSLNHDLSDLDIFGFELSAAEMATLSSF
jgi:diketogulonate reductase-like aldo/keto reductase